MSPPQWRAATVSAAAMATPRARYLTLDVPGWPGNLPGQHVDVRLTAEDGYQAVRSYSLASSGSASALELAVEELPDGEVSPYLVEDIEPGDQVDVLGPLGGYFVWRAEDPSPVQLIAGGSGIVPLRAMLRARLARGSGPAFRLLYSVRTAEDAMYRDELQAIDAPGIRVDWVYTRSAPEGWTGPVGRLDASSLDAAVPVEEDPIVYVCGPTGFVEAAAKILVARGYGSGRIRTERFGGA